MNVTRRLFLRNTAAVGAAVAAPVAAEAAVSATSKAVLSPREKVEVLAAQLALAMKEVHPDIQFYDVDHDLGMVIYAVGMRHGIKIEVGS